MNLGDDLDLPWEPTPPGATVDLDDCVIAGGVVVMGGVVSVGDVPVSALVFRFAQADGQLHRPIALILDEAQAAKLPLLVKQAAEASRRAARAAGR